MHLAFLILDDILYFDKTFSYCGHFWAFLINYDIETFFQLNRANDVILQSYEWKDSMEALPAF